MKDMNINIQAQNPNQDKTKTLNQGILQSNF